MKIEKVQRLVASYRNTTLAQVESKKFTTHGQLPDASQALAHAKWMCEEVHSMTDEGKAMRWLCFVQGVLWMTGRRTIDQMRDDNR